MNRCVHVPVAGSIMGTICHPFVEMVTSRRIPHGSKPDSEFMSYPSVVSQIAVSNTGLLLTWMSPCLPPPSDRPGASGPLHAGHLLAPGTVKTGPRRGPVGAQSQTSEPVVANSGVLGLKYQLFSIQRSSETRLCDPGEVDSW